MEVERLLKFISSAREKAKEASKYQTCQCEMERFVDQNSRSIRHEVFQRTWAQQTRAIPRPRSLHTRRSRILAMRARVPSRVSEVSGANVRGLCELAAAFRHEHDPSGRNYFANESLRASAFNEVIGIHTEVSRAGRYARAR